jgi:hypothetical protein
MSQSRIHRPKHKFILLPDSKEPMFASVAEKKNNAIMYFDNDGLPACINAFIREGAHICIICHNTCIGFIANEDGSYACSACGKYPRELIIHNA